jgi:peptidyl-prolyl isomerase E (cyclophilin E)
MTDISEKLVLYVGGLDDSVNDKILHAAFIPFGEIKSIELPLDQTTRKIYFLLKYKI